jgi:hypothetical protein
VAAAGERAAVRFLEFFAANIRNPHTRRAYYRAAEEFLAWCASAGVPSIAAVRPVHVASWIEAGTRELAAPSVKQRLAAIRHLFDWLVTGQVVPANPAGSVRGPRHVVTSGQTLVLDPSEARALLDSIDTSTVVGLRDRALVGLNGAGLRSDPKGPLFRTRYRQAHALGPPASERLCDDRPARGRRRHRHQARQSQLPGNRDHRLSQERRHARKGRRDGEPRLNPHDAALRSPAR